MIGFGSKQEFDRWIYDQVKKYGIRYSKVDYNAMSILNGEETNAPTLD